MSSYYPRPYRGFQPYNILSGGIADALLKKLAENPEIVAREYRGIWEYGARRTRAGGLLVWARMSTAKYKHGRYGSLPWEPANASLVYRERRLPPGWDSPETRGTGDGMKPLHRLGSAIGRCYRDIEADGPSVTLLKLRERTYVESRRRKFTSEESDAAGEGREKVFTHMTEADCRFWLDWLATRPVKTEASE